MAGLRNSSQHISLEVPRFGEFARQYAGIRSREIAACLEDQRRTGSRIGQILERSGLITADKRIDLLQRQARWAAQMHSREIAPHEFPLSTSVSVCLPCFNEGQVLEDVLLSALAVLPEFVAEYEVIVVDDGSTDQTTDIVERLAAKNDSIRLVRHERNRGYGAAVTSGLRAARGKWILLTDGDGQFNLLDLPLLLLQSQLSDVVIGYRHHRADSNIRCVNAQGWKWLIRALIGLRVRDLDCAFKLFPRWLIDQLQLTSSGACISAEILAQCTRGGAKLCEVPVNHFPRAAGKATGANLRVIGKALRELPIVWKYRRMKSWQVDRDRLGAFGREEPTRHQHRQTSAASDDCEDTNRISAELAPTLEN